MLVDNGFSFRRAHEIEAAILAAAALAALHGDDVARVADAEGIARELLYLPDEIFYDYSLAAMVETLAAALVEALVAERKGHGIGINHYLATIEKIAVNPIHYHPVALF